MQKKIFENHNQQSLEDELNNWLSENNVIVSHITVNATMMIDYYVDSTPPKVCNQWMQHIAIVIYKENN